MCMHLLPRYSFGGHVASIGALLDHVGIRQPKVTPHLDRMGIRQPKVN